MNKLHFKLELKSTKSFFSTVSLLRMPIRLLSVLRIGRRWQTDARSRYGCDGPGYARW